MDQLWEEAKLKPWDRLSAMAGKVTVGVCIICSVFGFIVGSSILICIYTLVVGLLASIVDLPSIYFFSGNAQLLHNQLERDFKMDHPLFKGAAYAALSLLTFVGFSLCALAGAFMLGTAAANGLAWATAERSGRGALREPHLGADGPDNDPSEP
ncbi:unnamed protein product, partial [Heterosigma akashiwo]